MNISNRLENEKNIFFLEGKIDHESAPLLEKNLNQAVLNGDSICLDFEKITYISSLGLRVLFSISKQLGNDKKLMIKNVSKDIINIFTITGFNEFIDIESLPIEISLENSELIGKGVSGECYKLSDETILKLYFDNIPADLPEKEKANAKAAFVAGIPTPISFELAVSGKRKGIIYEKLDAVTLSYLIVKDPENVSRYVNIFTELCKLIHNTHGNTEVFSLMKINCIDSIKAADFLSDIQKERIITRIMKEIPDSSTCIHGDLHTSNILMDQDIPFLIDMSDFSIGYYMFDIGQIYNLYYNSLVTGISEKALGMNPQLAYKVWLLFEEMYFHCKNESDRKRIREEASFYGCLRMFMFYHAQGKNENMKKWILQHFIPLFD